MRASARNQMNKLGEDIAKRNNISPGFDLVEFLKSEGFDIRYDTSTNVDVVKLSQGPNGTVILGRNYRYHKFSLLKLIAPRYTKLSDSSLNSAFVSSLIMPSAIFRNVFFEGMETRKTQEKTIPYMAAVFGVSEKAICARGSSLNFWDYEKVVSKIEEQTPILLNNVDDDKSSQINAAIEQLAESIFAQYALKPGFDIDDLINQLGGKIATYDFPPEVYLKSSYVEDEHGFTITIDSSYTYLPKKRFAVAKALLNRFMNQSVGIKEMNTFASSLLIPEELLRVAQANISSDVRELASFFGVSRQAMEIRIKSIESAEFVY